MKNLALAVVGALGVMFACYAGYWWLAQRMAWWTFALLFTGGFVGIQVVKETIKEVRKHG